MNSASDEIRLQFKGLLYDGDSFRVAGNFGDEFSAYRARRDWIKILGEYFLLERDRDYTILLADSRSGVIVTFTSAPGRYAFWRLFNKQTEKAEELLARGLSAPTRVVQGGVLR